jgi:hypothetical protein
VLEEMVGERYITHESDDERWEKYRRDHNLKVWQDVGQKGVSETYSYVKYRERPNPHGGKSAATTPTTPTPNQPPLFPPTPPKS